MRNKLIAREQIFQTKDDHSEIMQSMKLKQFRQREDKKRFIREDYLRKQEEKS